MTLARACGVVINGVEGLVVDIEAYLSQGLPGMAIVGLPDTAVGEARDRVRAAVQNSDLSWPSRASSPITIVLVISGICECADRIESAIPKSSDAPRL